jgi:hypothetical protein
LPLPRREGHVSLAEEACHYPNVTDRVFKLLRNP